jgi:hypothetical protein
MYRFVFKMSCKSLLKILNNSNRVLTYNSLMKHSTKGVNDGKIKKDKKTPVGRLDDDYDEAPKSYDEKEPLKPHPNNVNPQTGEEYGPKGLEPTRYGDWERKGRCIDF